jgi:Bcr/CflA subfamily drug resistance transporter
MNPTPEIQANRYRYAIMALIIIPMSGLCIDIFVPSLPEISQYFGVAKSLAQLTVTMYMIGIGAMQLFSGAISDSFGRKKPFLIGMALNIIVTLLIPFSQNIDQLLYLRLVQGILVGLLIVPIRAIFADLFAGKEYHKITTYSTLAWSIGPIVAPAIGGYLQHYFGWQSTFYFLTIYNVISFILILFFVPETSLYRHPFNVVSLLKRYGQILSHQEYIRALIINGALYSLVILFAIVGSFLIQKVLLFSPVEFGHMALLIGFSWFLGTMTNRFLIHVAADRKIMVCLWSLLIISIVSLIIVLNVSLNIYAIMIPTFVMVYVSGIVFPTNFANALSYFPKINASANALFGAFIFLVPAFSSAVGTLLKSNSFIPLLMTDIGIIIFCLLVYYVKYCFKSVREASFGA